MTIKLSKKDYALLKGVDLAEMGDTITFNDEEMSFDTSNMQLLQIILSEEVVTRGMIDQNEVTEYGREIYGLYDSILDSIPFHEEMVEDAEVYGPFDSVDELMDALNS